MTSTPNISPNPLPPAKAKSRPKWPLILAGIVVLGLIIFMVYGNANNNLVYYTLPSEYQKDEAKYAGKTLRLSGLAKDIQYNRDTLELRFNMTDGQVSYPVEYKGAVPDLFRKDAVVVIEGQMKNGTFYGSSLLVKHSEVYSADESKKYKYQRPEELKEFLEKSEP